jgi:hypothetical protein
MGPISFLYYEGSLVLSNLNSKLFRFHSAHPIIHTSSEFLKEEKIKSKALERLLGNHFLKGSLFLLKKLQLETKQK